MMVQNKKSPVFFLQQGFSVMHDSMQSSDNSSFIQTLLSVP